MDEAALFYKMLPSFTYFLPSEKNPHGTKQQKDRVTVILCCNMTGTHKLPLAILGSSKKPNFFNGFRPSIPYFSTPKAWANSALFQEWFSEIFVPFVRRKTTDPVLLILDNCSSHHNIQKDGITIILTCYIMKKFFYDRNL